MCRHLYHSCSDSLRFSHYIFCSSDLFQISQQLFSRIKSCGENRAHSMPSCFWEVHFFFFFFIAWQPDFWEFVLWVLKNSSSLWVSRFPKNSHKTLPRLRFIKRKWAFLRGNRDNTSCFFLFFLFFFFLLLQRSAAKSSWTVMCFNLSLLSSDFQTMFNGHQGPSSAGLMQPNDIFNDIMQTNAVFD